MQRKEKFKIRGLKQYAIEENKKAEPTEMGKLQDEELIM
jgi:hypothetical protein